MKNYDQFVKCKYLYIVITKTDVYNTYTYNTLAGYNIKLRGCQCNVHNHSSLIWFYVILR